jgi:hypothetical protein
MSEHTPEPWSVYEGENIHGVLDSEGKHLAEMWQRKQYNSLANARRIVACVNACEGISTETLEKVKLADVGDIQDALRDCLDQMERTPKSAVSPDFIAAIDDGRKALGES